MRAEIKGFIELLTPDVTEVVFGKQISQSPKNPYASFDIISNIKLGRAQKQSADSITNPTTRVTETVITQRQMNIQIKWYTKTESAIKEDLQKGITTVDMSAREFADQFTDKLESSSALDYMQDNNFSVLNYTDYSGIDEFLSDVWERRAMIEIQVGFATYSQEEIPFISGFSDLAGTPATIPGNYVNNDGSDL